MPNTRIVNYNLLDATGATLAATNVASLSSAEWLKTNKKSEILATTGTTTTITLTLAASETVGLVAFPICNLTPAATMRVQAGAVDTGFVSCVATPAKTYPNWKPAPDGVAGFAYGSGKYAIVWLETQATASTVTISISDSGNPQGHLEFSRLVVGEYYECEIGAEQGVGITPEFSSVNTRNGANDLMTNRAGKARKLSVNFKNVSDAQKHHFLHVLLTNGIDYPVFLSLLPGITDTLREHEASIFGKLSNASKVTLENFAMDAASIEVDEF